MIPYSSYLAEGERWKLVDDDLLKKTRLPGWRMDQA